MLDAIHESIERLRAIPTARRILLLISESLDRGSETTIEAATVAAQTAGVAIYALNYSADDRLHVQTPGGRRTQASEAENAGRCFGMGKRDAPGQT